MTSTDTALIGLPIAVFVSVVTYLGSGPGQRIAGIWAPDPGCTGLGPGIAGTLPHTAGSVLNQIFIRLTISVIVNVVADLDRHRFAGAAGIRHAFVYTACAVIVNTVAHLSGPGVDRYVAVITVYSSLSATGVIRGPVSVSITIRASRKYDPPLDVQTVGNAAETRGIAQRHGCIIIQGIMGTVCAFIKDAGRTAPHVNRRNPVPGHIPAGHVQGAVAVVRDARSALEVFACIKEEIPGRINRVRVGRSRGPDMAPAPCRLGRPEKDTAHRGLGMLSSGRGSGSDLGSKNSSTCNRHGEVRTRPFKPVINGQEGSVRKGGGHGA